MKPKMTLYQRLALAILIFWALLLSCTGTQGDNPHTPLTILTNSPSQKRTCWIRSKEVGPVR